MPDENVAIPEACRTGYFDYHLTPDDTLDKVDPEQLRQNVVAWTAMLSVIANAPEAILPAPVR